MTVTALPRPGDPLALLEAALAGLAGQRPVDLPGAVALERARALLAAVEQVRALALLAVADVDARELFALDGAGSAASWVADQRLPGAGRGDVTLARRLTACPRVAAELLAGRVGERTASRVCAAVARARPFLDRPDGLIDGQPGEPALRAVLVDGISTLLAEQTGGTTEADAGRLRAELTGIATGAGSQADRWEAGLLLLARRSAPGLLHGAIGLVTDALLPAEHDARALRAEADAGVELSRDPLGQGWSLRGRLDPVTGELLATALAAEGAVDPDSPADTTAWQATTDPALADLPPAQWPTAVSRPRSRPVRQHDALTRLLRRLLDTASLGERAKTAPHLLVLVPAEQLTGQPGALPARAAHGTTLTRRQLRGLACDIMITRLVLDARRHVIEASHKQRTATALERNIVHATWGGRCAVAGCARGPDTDHPLRPHHAELFSRTKQTALADTIPLCDPCHSRLHRDRRHLRLRDHRWIGPDGWHHAQDTG